MSGTMRMRDVTVDDSKRQALVLSDIRIMIFLPSKGHVRDFGID